MRPPPLPCAVLLVKVLLGRSSGEIFWGDLLERSSGDLGEVLPRDPFTRSSCEDPGEDSLKRPLRDLVQVLVRISCGDSAEILSNMSSQHHLEVALH